MQHVQDKECLKRKYYFQLQHSNLVFTFSSSLMTTTTKAKSRNNKKKNAQFTIKNNNLIYRASFRVMGQLSGQANKGWPRLVFHLSLGAPSKLGTVRLIGQESIQFPRWCSLLRSIAHFPAFFLFCFFSVSLVFKLVVTNSSFNMMQHLHCIS